MVLVVEEVLYLELLYALRFNVIVLFLVLNESIFVYSNLRHGQKYLVFQTIYSLACILFPIAEIVVAAYLHLLSFSFYFGSVELRIVIEPTISGEQGFVRCKKHPRKAVNMFYLPLIESSDDARAQKGVSMKSKYFELCPGLMESPDM